MSFSQPIKGAIAANIRRIMKLRMESTVALMSEKVIWLMYPLRMGVAKPRKAGVRKVESQGDISADYKNEDQDSHLTRTEVVVHPVGPESGEADRQIQYRPNNAIPGNGSFQIH